MIIHRLVSFLVAQLNLVLRSLGGTKRQTPAGTSERSPWFYAHWANENEDREGRPKGFPWKARFWIHGDLGGTHRVFRLEYVLGTFKLGAALGAASDCENDLTGHVQIPMISVYWGLQGLWPKWVRKVWESRYRYDKREISLRFFDYGCWWNLWSDPDNWNSKTPRWRSGSWHYLDTFLGKSKHSTHEISNIDVVIPMPEGSYPASVKLCVDTWKRRLWFGREINRAHVKLKIPIPFQGKGENSWDCGQDALYAVSTCALTIEEAIAKTMESALHSRRRYDGNVMAKYPPPAPILVPVQ